MNLILQIHSVLYNLLLIQRGMYTAGTSQGLKLTLNLETDEYMAGPASGSGAFVSNLYLTHYKINKQI